MQKAALYPGFEGATAFTTSICRPSGEGDELRYRGVDISELVGVRPYDDVWRLLVDGDPGSGLLAEVDIEEVAAVLRGSESPRVTLQRALLEFGESQHMVPSRGPGDVGLRNDLAALTTAFSVGLGILLARRTLGPDATFDPVSEGRSVAGQLVQIWRGHPEPQTAKVLDGVLSAIAEHGTTASTFAARVVASTGADASACVSAALAAIGGPRHGGATRGAVELLRAFDAREDSMERIINEMLAQRRRLPGFGHRVYRQQDPRVAIFRAIAIDMKAPLADTATEYERVAGDALKARGGTRRLPPNVDIWLPVVLDGLGIPDDMADAVLAAGKMAGWSAHIVEQVESGGKLMRPTDIYVGTEFRTLV